MYPLVAVRTQSSPAVLATSHPVRPQLSLKLMSAIADPSDFLRRIRWNEDILEKFNTQSKKDYREIKTIVNCWRAEMLLPKYNLSDQDRQMMLTATNSLLIAADRLHPRVQKLGSTITTTLNTVRLLKKETSLKSREDLESFNFDNVGQKVFDDFILLMLDKYDEIDTQNLILLLALARTLQHKPAEERCLERINKILDSLNGQKGFDRGLGMLRGAVNQLNNQTHEQGLKEASDTSIQLLRTIIETALALLNNVGPKTEINKILLSIKRLEKIKPYETFNQTSGETITVDPSRVLVLLCTGNEQIPLSIAEYVVLVGETGPMVPWENRILNLQVMPKTVMKGLLDLSQGKTALVDRDPLFYLPWAALLNMTRLYEKLKEKVRDNESSMRSENNFLNVLKNAKRLESEDPVALFNLAFDSYFSLNTLDSHDEVKEVCHKFFTDKMMQDRSPPPLKHFFEGKREILELYADKDPLARQALKFLGPRPRRFDDDFDTLCTVKGLAKKCVIV